MMYPPIPRSMHIMNRSLSLPLHAFITMKRRMVARNSTVRNHEADIGRDDQEWFEYRIATRREGMLPADGSKSLK